MLTHMRFLLLLATICLATCFPGSVVHSDDGPVQGSRHLLTGVTTYHGVPFAAPPIADLRWKAPTRPAPWTKTRRTTFPGPSCPQFDFVKGFVLGKEDCLYLSVYVPKGCTADTPCPVMQWVYGGAWIIGSNREFGLYDASNFAKKHGVVVVAANYRLDTFGWLALDELGKESQDGSYGNYGLKDQRLAFQWTQRNVKLFGGDPNKVTIFGESAGGWSVCQHLVSPASNHLFSHAIIESGDCDGPWMILDGLNAKRFGDAFATAQGCNSTVPDRLACLRSLSTEDAMEPYTDWICLGHRNQDPYCNKSKTVSDPNAWPNLLYNPKPDETGKLWPTPLPPMAPVAAFAAVVDGSDTGLPDVPLRLMQAGRINLSPTGEKISVILGTNADEFALFLIAIDLVIPQVKLPFRTGGMAEVAHHLIQYHDGWNKTTAKQIVAEYDPKQFKTQSEMIVTAGTDFCFRCGTRTAARALNDAGIKTYLYQFAFHSKNYKNPGSEVCHLTSELLCGVFHADEVKYVFGSTSDPATAKMSSAIGTYWSNMAKHGTPNGQGDVDVEWPVYNTTFDMHLELANTIKPASQLAKEKCDFWDTLPRMGPYSY